MSNIRTLVTLYMEKWNDASLMTHNFIYPLISPTKEIKKILKYIPVSWIKRNIHQNQNQSIFETRYPYVNFNAAKVQKSKSVVWSLEIYLITYHSSNKLITVRSKEVSDQFSQWKHPGLFHGLYTDDQRFVIR